MAEFDVEAAVRGVAEQARKVIADAEARATEIVRAAEREAEGIRGRAEAEARDQVEGARRALAELTSRFGSGAVSGAPPPPPPGPPTPEPPAPAPAAAEPEPPPAEPEPPAPAPEPEPPAPTASAEPAADDSQAARLVAMKMALDGASREAIEAELERSYTLPDRGALLDEVLARVGK